MKCWGIDPTVKVENPDAGPLGKGNMVETDEEGQEFGFRGLFHEMIMPQPLI